MANYVDKDRLYADICDWQDAVEEAKLYGMPEPKMPDSIGRVIMDIANHLGTRWNFRGYSYVDEMILDGILAGVRAVPMFDRNNEKKNPFGFLSFVVWRAFLNRLKKEKDEHAGKMSMMLDGNYEGFDIGVQDGDMRLDRHQMIDMYSK